MGLKQDIRERLQKLAGLKEGLEDRHSNRSVGRTNGDVNTLTGDHMLTEIQECSRDNNVGAQGGQNHIDCGGGGMTCNHFGECEKMNPQMTGGGGGKNPMKGPAGRARFAKGKGSNRSARTSARTNGDVNTLTGDHMLTQEGLREMIRELIKEIQSTKPKREKGQTTGSGCKPCTGRFNQGTWGDTGTKCEGCTEIVTEKKGFSSDDPRSKL